MALFNFFGDGEHRVFTHKPIYYKADESALSERNRKAHARDRAGRARAIIGIISLLLICVILFFILKFFTILY